DKISTVLFYETGSFRYNLCPMNQMSCGLCDHCIIVPEFFRIVTGRIKMMSGSSCKTSENIYLPYFVSDRMHCIMAVDLGRPFVFQTIDFFKISIWNPEKNTVRIIGCRSEYLI